MFPKLLHYLRWPWPRKTTNTKTQYRKTIVFGKHNTGRHCVLIPCSKCIMLFRWPLAGKTKKTPYRVTTVFTKRQTFDSMGTRIMLPQMALAKEGKTKTYKETIVFGKHHTGTTFYFYSFPTYDTISDGLGPEKSNTLFVMFKTAPRTVRRAAFFCFCEFSAAPRAVLCSAPLFYEVCWTNRTYTHI